MKDKIKLENINAYLQKRKTKRFCWEDGGEIPDPVKPGDIITLHPINGVDSEPFIIDNEISVVVVSIDNNIIIASLDLCDGINTAVEVKFDKDYAWSCSRG